MLLLPARWRRQPFIGARISQKWQRRAFHVALGSQRVNLATGAPEVVTGTPTTVYVPGGDAIGATTTNNTRIALQVGADTPNWTLVVVVVPASVTGDQQFVAWDSGSGTDRRFQFRSSGTAVQFVVFNTAGYVGLPQINSVLAIGVPTAVVITQRGADARLFANGQIATQAISGTPVSILASNPTYGNWFERYVSGGNEHGSHQYLLRAFLNGGVSDADGLSLAADPWQLFEPQPSRLYFLQAAAGGAGVEATSAITIGAITASSAATVTVDATSAATIAAVTVSSAADVAVTATSATTVPAITVSSAATVDVAVTSAVAVDNLTVVSAATVSDGPIATLAATIDAVTVSSAATVDVAATTAATVPAITVASAASVDVVATSAATVAAVTLSSAASVSSGPEATLAATIEPITVASSATVAVVATLSGTFDPITLLAEANNGVVEVRGVVPAGAPGPSGRKKTRRPRPMRRVQIGDKDYLIPERDFPAFMEAMLRKQPPPPSVEVEPAPAPKAKAKPVAKPAPAATPVAQAFNDAVLEPAVEELREAVEEHRPDLLPAFYEQALQAYIERTVQGEVAKALAGLRPYLEASIALQTEVRDTVRTLRRDLADDMHALGVMID